ncbi:hypothetical protein PCANC_07051 [Puccinia coronata f. sp. avenae]|uniref:Uncharacterized protein n=1 Tax=Puccinia coronata f. sp. avenae TaxID=200324 RepID=A0A2N5VZQ4_9BASI|nr:hypothetical protein PCANC_07051 [Puccinia coronata f. sp. avenae]
MQDNRRFYLHPRRRLYPTPKFQTASHIINTHINIHTNNNRNNYKTNNQSTLQAFHQPNASLSLLSTCPIHRLHVYRYGYCQGFVMTLSLSIRSGLSIIKSIKAFNYMPNVASQAVSP